MLIILSLLVSSALAQEKAPKELPKIVPTGVEAIDAIFKPVKKVQGDLKIARDELARANKTIRSALKVQDGDNVGDKLKQFAQDNGIKVVIEPTELSAPSPKVKAPKESKLPVKMPKLPGVKLGSGDKKPKSIKIPLPKVTTTSGDGSAQRVVAALSSAVDSSVKVVKTCISIPGALQATLPQVVKLPLESRKLIKEAGFGPEETKAIGKKVKANAAATTSIPGLAVQTLGEAKSLIGMVASLAGKTEEAKAAAKAEKADKKAKKKAAKAAAASDAS